MEKTNIELILSNKATSFVAQLGDALQKQHETQSTISSLMEMHLDGNATLSAILAEQTELAREQSGYTLGLLKANLDATPPELANQQKVNGVPLQMMVKLKLDEQVLEPRKKFHPSEMTFATGKWEKYRRLSEIICGYGYSLRFDPDRFADFFPKGIHRYVAGFAMGYSSALHAITAEEGIEMSMTDPITQDIWRNWRFFLQHDCFEYSLEGLYLFPYHGGWNCSSDPDLPMGNNVKDVNKDLYLRLRTRSVKNFHNQEFDIQL